MKKYWKLPEICSKNLENHKFSFTPCREEVTWQLPRAAGAFKFFFKSDRDMVKISYAKFAEFFYEKILQQGVYKDPQMQLTVKNGKVFK